MLWAMKNMRSVYAECYLVDEYEDDGKCRKYMKIQVLDRCPRNKSERTAADECGAIKARRADLKCGSVAPETTV